MPFHINRAREIRDHVSSIADRISLDEQYSFTEAFLMGGFRNEIAEHGTLEKAVCSYLIGGENGAYTLARDRKTTNYILKRVAYVA